MALYCCESNIANVLKAYEDVALLEDERVLQNLLVTEDRYTISSSYFKCIQTDLKPYMRKVVSSWLLEVCEEEACQDEVFTLAMNTLDRFLSIVPIRKSQLQLLATVCVLLASKLRQTRPLLVEKLCLYTDYSVTIEEVLGWEILVLSRLKWDLNAITPNDFLDHILQRMPLGKGKNIVRKHAQTFIALCATDFKFSMYPASMIAAASLGAAVQGLIWLDKTWTSQSDLLEHLHGITGIEVDCLRGCLEQIEEMVSSQLSTEQKNSGVSTFEKIQPVGVATDGALGAETPTDVQDIHF